MSPPGCPHPPNYPFNGIPLVNICSSPFRFSVRRNFLDSLVQESHIAWPSSAAIVVVVVAMMMKQDRIWYMKDIMKPPFVATWKEIKEQIGLAFLKVH